MIAGTTISNQAQIINQQPQQIRTSNLVQLIVQLIRGLDLNEADPKTTLSGEWALFPKVLYNVGNSTENISLSTDVSTACIVQWRAEDEITVLPSVLELGPGQSKTFFMAVLTTASVGSVLQITANAELSGSSVGKYRGNNDLFYGGPAALAIGHRLTVIDFIGVGPLFSELSLDGIPFVSGDFIGRQPLIRVKVQDPEGIDTNSLKISIDGRPMPGAPTMNGEYLIYRVPLRLSDGDHKFVLEAKDMLGNASELKFVGKISTVAKLVGKVLPYPNPYDPREGDVKITYQLTSDKEIRLAIYTITGEKVWATTCYRGTVGGRAGFNEVAWSGRNAFSRELGNGVYLLFVSDEKGNIITRTKILIIR